MQPSSRLTHTDRIEIMREEYRSLYGLAQLRITGEQPYRFRCNTARQFHPVAGTCFAEGPVEIGADGACGQPSSLLDFLVFQGLHDQLRQHGFARRQPQFAHNRSPQQSRVGECRSVRNLQPVCGRRAAIAWLCF